jgi:branched-chain amino acid transport system substrate-binding protein
MSIPHKLPCRSTSLPAKAASPSQAGEAVNIGFFGPLENSPDVAPGLAMLHGAQLAIDEANSRQSGQDSQHKSRWKYELKIHNDTAPWGAATMEPVKMALDEHVVAVLGSIDGAPTHTLLRISSELGFPVLNTATADPSIRETATPWLMHLHPDDLQQSRVLAQYILAQSKMRKLGIISEDARYARIGTQVFTQEITRNQPIQIVQATFQPGAKEFSQQLQRFKDAGIDGLLLWCQPQAGALILQQLRAAGMDIPAFGPSELATSQLISLGGTATEGFAAVSLFNPARTDPEFRQFQRRYRHQFDESPDEYAAYAYDGINLLIAAIEKAGPDRSRVMNELRSHQSRDWEGITGKMHFDERLNNMASPGMARVEGGRFVYWMPAQT